MGAWAYCVRCNTGFDLPTLKEALAGEQRCSYCGYERQVDATEKGLVCDTVQSQIADLQTKMDALMSNEGVNDVKQG